MEKKIAHIVLMNLNILTCYSIAIISSVKVVYKIN